MLENIGKLAECSRALQ